MPKYNISNLKKLKNDLPGYSISEIEGQIFIKIKDSELREELPNITEKLPSDFVIEGVARIDKDRAYILIGEKKTIYK
jgi:hypothetical protein